MLVIECKEENKEVVILKTFIRGPKMEGESDTCRVVIRQNQWNAIMACNAFAHTIQSISIK